MYKCVCEISDVVNDRKYLNSKLKCSVKMLYMCNCYIVPTLWSIQGNHVVYSSVDQNIVY